MAEKICKECGKPERAKCYGCVMTLEHHDLDQHDIDHDTYGNRGAYVERDDPANYWSD